ncbi:hypothetical protein N7E81_04130 [Reichenbachiella carrageenanivorans]|uniref:WG containing repeat-containing protein n=1 Tax=Reichenbachiella carrageenanivorans TaxID=2979869 RepID=A0ABY6D2B0_9BACT|nr:hypothetical protein [Reichenbachiella carrageenanivorans]UXX80287.1 hypothetical protein N7E81_04130 [Reichenbachiella carrageenanivorans]
MKKILIISSFLSFCALFLVEPINAQKKLKYEDVLPSILNGSTGNGVSDLKLLIEEEPENPSMYLQLALLYNKRFEDSDPITGYKKAMANIALANTALDNCEKFLTEKEVKKNKEEYVNFAIYDDKMKYTVSIDTIYTKIINIRTEMAAFENHMPAIYESFTKSYSHYDKANKIFTQLIGDHATLKDLYLLYDENMEKDFIDIKENYNQFLSAFQAYQDSIAIYDIGYYQQLEIDTINIYKLDGLAVEINFLEHEKIPIWNYAKWTDEVRAYIQSRISTLRQMMATNEKAANTKIKQVTTDFNNGIKEPLSINKEFLFTLRKFDLNSVVEPLFLYKEKKYTLLHNELATAQMETSTDIAPDRKIFNYGLMLNAFTKSDTLLQEVETRNTEESFQKYKPFLTTYYKGQSGITTLVSTARKENRTHFDTYVEKIQHLSRHLLNGDSTLTTVKYRGIVIPDYVTRITLDSIHSSNKITTHKVVNIDGSAYLGGVFLHPKTNLITTFACRKEANSTISWYKELSMQVSGENAHTLLTAMTNGQGGCSLLLNAHNPITRAQINTLYTYSDNGAEQQVKNLTISEFPRFMVFEEQTNTFLIGFNGIGLEANRTEASKVILANYNVVGDLKWQYAFELMGDLSGLVTLEDGYLLSGNYSRIKDESGKFVRIDNGYAAYLMKVNNSGQLSKQVLLPNSLPYITTHLYKAGDHCINLFGSKDLSQHQFESNSSNLVHFIVNRQLDTVSSSID